MSPTPGGPTHVEPTAKIDPQSRVDYGSHIDENCTIESDCSVSNSHLAEHVTVRAGSIIGSWPSLFEEKEDKRSQRTRIGARTRIGPKARIGAGSTIGEDVTISYGVKTGFGVTIGNGAVILPKVTLPDGQDVPPGSVVYGNRRFLRRKAFRIIR